MSMIVTGLRRALWLALIATVGGAVWTWWRDRDTSPLTAPAEWPPLAPDTAAPDTAAPDSAAPDTAAPVAAATSATSEVEAINGTQTWLAPDDHGSCPLSHPIKAKDNSGIFHLPGGRFHERTNAERCYANAEDAVTDGYRQAKN